jgi:hypothetical protein
MEEPAMPQRLLAILFMILAPHGASAVTDATFEESVRAVAGVIDEDEGVLLNEIENLDVSAERIEVNRIEEASASIGMVGLTAPEIQLDVRSVAYHVGGLATSESQASGDLTYTFIIRHLNSPTFDLLSMRIRVLGVVSGSASLPPDVGNAGGTGQVSWLIARAAGGEISANWNISCGSDTTCQMGGNSLNVDEYIDVISDREYTVYLSAEAFTRTQVFPQTGEAEHFVNISAFIDPVIEFADPEDADNYVLEYSPQLVPEPGPATLAISALGALAILRGRRRRTLG